MNTRFPTATDALHPADKKAQVFFTGLSMDQLRAVLSTMDSVRERQYAWTLVHLAILDRIEPKEYAQARAILKLF